MDPEIDPAEAAEQMREATERLREQGWMVAPMTSSIAEPAAAADETLA